MDNNNAELNDDSAHNESVWRLRAFKAVAIIGGLFVLAAVIAVCGFFWQAVAMVVFAALLALMLNNAIDGMEKRVRNRVAATFLVYALFIIVILALLLVFVPMAAAQFLALVEEIPTYGNALQEWAGTLSDGDENILSQNVGAITEGITAMLQSEQVLKAAGDVATSLATGIVGAFDGIGAVFTIVGIGFILAFMISLDWPVISRELRSLVSSDHLDDYDILVGKVGTVVSGWLGAVLTCAVCNGIICGLIFWAIGVPFAGLYGFICAVFYIIPGLGPIIAAVFCGILALFSSILHCVIVVVVCIAVPNILAGTLSPYLMRDSVNVHPVFMLVGMTMGFAVGGVVGALAAVPLIAIALALFVFFFERKNNKEISTANGAFFRKTGIVATGKKVRQEKRMGAKRHSPQGDSPDDELRELSRVEEDVR